MDDMSDERIERTDDISRLERREKVVLSRVLSIKTRYYFQNDVEALIERVKP